MKKTNKLLALILVLMLALSVALVGCAGGNNNSGSTSNGGSASNGGTSANQSGGDSQGDQSTSTKTYKDLVYENGTVLRMATGYNSADTGIAFSAKIAGEGLKMIDGTTYNTGDLKPTWKHLQNVLNVVFEDKYTGKTATNTYSEFKEKLGEVDMVAASASQANEAGAAGELVNIAEYLEYMPNFDAYLQANPIVRLSITGDTTTGAIYFSPYFDGSDDIERMPLMKADWVKKLLNGSGAFTAEQSANTAASVYTPYMPTSGSVEVEVVDAVAASGATTTKKIAKDYSKYGNIVARMNAVNGGVMTGVEAVNMLREYIDQTYGGYYGENRANLFIGQNAAWDADEMVALLRCVVANAYTLNGGTTVTGLFSREDANNQRTVDLFRFAGILFGARGLESRQDYLYFGTDGKLYDARNQAATYVALEKMNAMKQEGLISADYNNPDASNAKSENYIKNANGYSGFMSYDYNQTQTIWSNDNIQYMAVLVPVANWQDEANASHYMRFTESWRSVKTDAWAISKAGVGNDQNKLFAALKLIDYAYSAQGSITMSYGPDDYINVKNASAVVNSMADVADKYETFDFNGQKWPTISADTFADLQAKTGGNYTNYARQYLGSTLSFLKSQAFEVQCTSAVGKLGATQISYAIAAGVIKHPLLAVNTANMWYTSIPTVLPMTNDQNTAINTYTNLSASGKYSSAKGGTNALVNIIASGYAGVGEAGVTNAATMIAQANTWGVQDVLDIKNASPNGPWARLLAYYMTNIVA